MAIEQSAVGDLDGMIQPSHEKPPGKARPIWCGVDRRAGRGTFF